MYAIYTYTKIKDEVPTYKKIVKVVIVFKKSEYGGGFFANELSQKFQTYEGH